MTVPAAGLPSCLGRGEVERRFSHRREHVLGRVLYNARMVFARVLTSCGGALPVWRDISINYVVECEDYEFRVRFAEHQPWHWRENAVVMHQLEMTAADVSRECRRVWEEMVGDFYGRRRRLDPPMMAVGDTVRDVDLRPGAITWVDADHDERTGGALRPIMIGMDYATQPDRMAFTLRPPMPDPFNPAFDYLRRLHHPDAERKGLTLLKQWLSPKQLAQFEKDNSFEVTGSTGKRYRIRNAASYNVDRLNGNGMVTATYCFVPEGSLVPGDVMLAQKIALETDEEAAIAVANVRDGGGTQRRSMVLGYDWMAGY